MTEPQRPATTRVGAAPWPVLLRDLGRTRYRTVFAAMQAFTAERDQATQDEIWFTEHDPVFTQGQAGKAEHLLAPGGIEVVASDRGGQVTYHGPGQIVGYLLFDIRRMGISVRSLVCGIEQAIVGVLSEYGVVAKGRRDAPGVYVEEAKVAALGLRVRRGCAYHGFSFNIDMNLEPFGRINPCGLSGLQVTQLRDLATPDSPSIRLDDVRNRLIPELERAYPIRGCWASQV